MIKLPIWVLLVLAPYVMADQQPLIAEVKPIIQEFGKTLKAELKGAMMTGGPVKGLSVCNVQAPLIAQKSSESGWGVSRTSLKWRNDNNQPDDWEKQQLEIFDQKLKAGTPPSKLWAVLETDKETRVMKAITTEGICLACHGKTLDPAVTKKIKDLYPSDRATGYSVGEVRGAFSLKKHSF